MESDRGFNFKLLIPSKMNNGQVSAVRLQDNDENYGNFMNTLQQGYRKCYDKEQSVTLPGKSMVAPTKPTQQAFPKMKVVSPMEKDKNNCHPGQLFSKLFDEVEKIKCWKVQLDSDAVQNERRLQENKRTIETQRKVIQELQFGNESLSIKLEEQISDNESLRNKNNATKNLCNILKDTFERSAEKMHIFESEREETYHLFMENSESIQKLIAAFESLRFRAEADQQEMLKVKASLLQFEELKEKYHQDYIMKKEEVVVLQTKLRDKENELQKILLNFHESQKHCKQLEEGTNEQYDLLRSLKTEKESLLQELHIAKQCCEETEKHCEAITALLEQSKKENAEMIKRKDLKLDELSRVKNQQAEQLEQIQTTTRNLQNSLAVEIQRAKQLEDELVTNNKGIERKNILLGEAIEQGAMKDEQIKILEDDLDKKSKSVDAMKVKIDLTEARLEKLTAELSRKTKEAQLLKNEAEAAFAENDLLKKACEAVEKAKEDLMEKSTMAEIKVQELEEQLFTEKQENKEHIYQMEQLRQDITQVEVKYKELLNNFNELQSEKTAIQQQFEGGSSNKKVNEVKAVKLTTEIQRLEDENQCLQEEINTIKTNIQGKYLKAETLEKKIEETYEHMQDEITQKAKQIKSLETKLCNLRKKIEMNKAQEDYKKENKVLKKQIAKEISKSSHLEIVIKSLHEECENLKRLNKEDHLLKDLEYKSKLAAELNNEVQKLRSTVAEATKTKEETELKCQHKIADMVALMGKHKSQYDRIIEEKDAQLDEEKRKEMEAAAHSQSMELDLQKCKADQNQLKQQLKREVTEKENLQKELTDLKKEISSMKVTLLSKVTNKGSLASNCKQGRCSEAPKECSSKRRLFDFSKTRKIPSHSKDEEIAAILKKADVHNEDQKTLRSLTNTVSETSEIKSYRVRTPPSALATCWKNSTFELDPMSDSSDQSDIFSFASTQKVSAPRCQTNFLKKIQSPVNQKSPGNTLKFAAMKRMRDAGWTAVTSCDKKKKKISDNIFA